MQILINPWNSTIPSNVLNVNSKCEPNRSGTPQLGLIAGPLLNHHWLNQPWKKEALQHNTMPPIPNPPSQSRISCLTVSQAAERSNMARMDEPLHLTYQESSKVQPNIWAWILIAKDIANLLHQGLLKLLHNHLLNHLPKKESLITGWKLSSILGSNNGFLKRGWTKASVRD